MCRDLFGRVQDVIEGRKLKPVEKYKKKLPHRHLEEKIAEEDYQRILAEYAHQIIDSSAGSATCRT